MPSYVMRMPWDCPSPMGVRASASQQNRIERPGSRTTRPTWPGDVAGLTGLAQETLRVA
jgi:hypothetical protein